MHGVRKDQTFLPAQIWVAGNWSRHIGVGPHNQGPGRQALPTSTNSLKKVGVAIC